MEGYIICMSFWHAKRTPCCKRYVVSAVKYVHEQFVSFFWFLLMRLAVANAGIGVL